MLNVSRPWSVRSLFFCLSLITCLGASAARAQAPQTEWDRQLARLQLGATAIGIITPEVSGTNALNPPSQMHITQDGSQTVGVLGTLRYTKSPLVGLEANYSFARYTENFSAYIIGGAQTRVNEYSLGWVFHLPTLLTTQPFVSLGAGTTAFHPTAGGGQGLPFQYRATYYYNIGLDKSLFKSEHFGARIAMREVFFKAPDFGQNYLTIQQQATTFEPSVGFYLKF
jgi:hypothetical protein